MRTLAVLIGCVPATMLLAAAPASGQAELLIPGAGELAKLGPAGAILAAFVVAVVVLYRTVLAPSQREARETAAMQATTAIALLETQKLQKARDDQAGVQIALMQGHNDGLGKLITRLLDRLDRFDRTERTEPGDRG